jgi:hypothetical protein
MTTGDGSPERRRLVPIVDRWTLGKAPDAWLFEAARAIGGILGAAEPPAQQDEGADDTDTDESAW